MSEQFEATWASKDETLLRAAVEVLVSNGVAVSPITRVEWFGELSWAVRISDTKQLPEPPTGVVISSAAVAGVFMRGPAKPTPREWINRLSKETQFRIYATGQQSAEVGFLLFNLSTAKEIDVRDSDTIAGVTALRTAQLLTEEEAQLLLTQ